MSIKYGTSASNLSTVNNINFALANQGSTTPTISFPVNAVNYDATPVWRRQFSFNYTINTKSIKSCQVTRTYTENPGTSVGELTTSIVYYNDELSVFCEAKPGYYIDGDNPRTIKVIRDNNITIAGKLASISAPTIYLETPVGGHYTTVKLPISINQEDERCLIYNSSNKRGLYLSGMVTVMYNLSTGTPRYKTVNITNQFVDYDEEYAPGKQICVDIYLGGYFDFNAVDGMFTLSNNITISRSGEIHESE